MSTLEQAARKALEWMEWAWYQIDCEWGPCGKTLDQACADGNAPEIEALRAALEAPQAGPVGEAFWHAVVSQSHPIIDKAIRRRDIAYEYAQKAMDNYPDATDTEVIPLYAAPQPAAPAPERVPLTDTEIYALAEEESKDHFINFRVFSLGVKAAERAHGITKEPQR